MASEQFFAPSDGTSMVDAEVECARRRLDPGVNADPWAPSRSAITMAPRSWPNGKRLIVGEPHASVLWVDPRLCPDHWRGLPRRQHAVGARGASDDQLGRGRQEY